MQKYSCALATVFALGSLFAPALARPAAAQVADRVVIPANTVVRLELAERVRSETARVGERVTARLDEADRSGFPEGTRFEGVVTEVRRATEERPAVLDMEFRRAILPDGTVETIDGDLVSLAAEDIRETTDGRVVSRRGGGGGFDWKWVGIGAAGGAVLGEIFGDSFLKGALLGGLGGAIYGYLTRGRDRDFREITLDRGTDFGIRLDQQVAFLDRSNYRYFARDPFDRDFDRDRVLGTRGEFRGEPRQVFLNGRLIDFDDQQPVVLNRTLYLPLEEVAEAAGWEYRKRPFGDNFVLYTPSGRIYGSAGDRSVLHRDGQTVTLESAPITLRDNIYVPLEYLSRVAEMRIEWDRADDRLELTTIESRFQPTFR